MPALRPARSAIVTMWSVKTWPKPGSCQQRRRAPVGAARRASTGRARWSASLMHGPTVPATDPLRVRQPRRRRSATPAARRRRPRGVLRRRRCRRARARSAATAASDPRRPLGRGRGGRAACATDRIVAVGSATPVPGDVRAPSRAPARTSTGWCRLTSRLPLAARPMPPVIAAAEVGDDVAEEVVGDDDVEALRLR